MWKMTLFSNLIILVLLWLLSIIIITPSYNLLVQYAESSMPLPILTDFAMRVQSFAWIMPLSWGVFSLFFGKWISGKQEGRRNAYVTAHTSLTLCLGFVMVVFFSCATILPILKISAIEL